MPDLEFPPGFLWGAATSAHQVEGGNTNNDWWQWEQAGKVPPAGSAADSWNRWREDLDLAVRMDLQVFRISVEWSRIEPRPGQYDESVLSHYADVLKEVRARGLQTMVVLWHFTNPSWLVPVNDWLWRETPDRFADFASVVANRLGSLVDHWVTLNEANTYVWRGFIVGNWPPGRHDAWIGAYLCYRGLAEGHRRARRAIKAVCGDSTPVGLTHVLAWPHPAKRGGRFSGPMIAWWNLCANDMFLDMVMPETEWLGVQYYHDSPARTVSIDNDDDTCPRTDMGWRITPHGLYEVVIRAWRRYGKPMMVTENGLADAADRQRGRFIIDHLAWLKRSMDEGADVRGYLHWSLIDNYEWAEGYGPRFGLAEVDYGSGERRLRPSGRLYGEIVRHNGVPEGMGDELTYADGTRSLAPKGTFTSC